ncbi:MAG TPA: hypothetical protein VFO43_00120, partial [Thiobacillus sp.]|nr:hypothetical protein [Thiobacillus sp.]
MQTVPGKRTALLTVSLVLSACGGGGGGGGTVPDGTPVPTFTKWSNVLPGSTVQVDGSGHQVSGKWDASTGTFTDVTLASPVSEGYSAILTFDQALVLTQLALKSASTLVSFDRAVFTDLTLAPADSTLTPGPSQFVGAGSPGANAAILANPMNLVGWEYQTFGIWETASTDGTRTFGAMSVGNDAGTAIPGSGGATFAGYAAGTY